VHPECPLAIRALAQVVGSTAQLLTAVTKGGPKDEWIVVTEPGIIHQMQLRQPQARFIPAPRSLRSGEEGSCTQCNTCPHMRRNTLEKLLACMERQEPRIELPAELIAAARKPIDRMLAIG
jgi:quinolinate synthase